jgi:hypothetical protein
MFWSQKKTPKKKKKTSMWKKKEYFIWQLNDDDHEYIILFWVALKMLNTLNSIHTKGMVRTIGKIPWEI